jgi:hypothetical protein
MELLAHIAIMWTFEEPKEGLLCQIFSNITIVYLVVAVAKDLLILLFNVHRHTKTLPSLMINCTAG